MSSNQLIELLMKEYEKVVEENCLPSNFAYSNEIPLPIDKINGLKCSVGFVLCRKSVLLLITSDNIYENGNCELRELYRKPLIHCNDINDKDKKFNKDDFVMVLVNLKKTLTELYFDKYYGEFRTKNDTTFGKEFASLLADIDNVKLTCDDCCVCSVNTTTKTPCGHHLCVDCWDRIPNNNADIIPCPICREDIKYINYDE